jgi:hypothetical protein
VLLLLQLGLSPLRKVLDPKDRVRCRGCGTRTRAVVSIKWAGMMDDDTLTLFPGISSVGGSG